MAILDTFPVAHVPGKALPPQPALLIGLVGRAGAGKSTVARMLEDEFSFVELAFADPLVAMISALFHEADIGAEFIVDPKLKNLATPLGYSYRHLVQTLGDWGRNLDAEMWARILRRRMVAPHLDGQSIVVSDVRLPLEAALITNHGGQLWRVQRESPMLHGVAGEHVTEAFADVLPVHATLYNTGSLATLGDQVARHIDALRGRQHG